MIIIGFVVYKYVSPVEEGILNKKNLWCKMQIDVNIDLGSQATTYVHLNVFANGIAFIGGPGVLLTY